MRNKSAFIKRFMIGMNLAFRKKNARIMTCGNCNSTDLIPISNALEEPFSTENIKADLMYVQFTKCRKCGAVCKELQLWSNSGNVYDIDPKLKDEENNEE
jgi:CO dehydrogenase/acetyl-CoA synthase alpha subunit